MWYENLTSPTHSRYGGAYRTAQRQGSCCSPRRTCRRRAVTLSPFGPVEYEGGASCRPKPRAPDDVSGRQPAGAWYRWTARQTSHGVRRAAAPGRVNGVRPTRRIPGRCPSTHGRGTQSSVGSQRRVAEARPVGPGSNGTGGVMVDHVAPASAGSTCHLRKGWRRRSPCRSGSSSP